MTVCVEVIERVPVMTLISVDIVHL